MVLPRPPTVPALVRVAVTVFLVDSCGMPTTTLSALHVPCPRFSSRETGEAQIFLLSPGLPESCAAAMFPFTLPPAKQSVPWPLAAMSFPGSVLNLRGDRVFCHQLLALTRECVVMTLSWGGGRRRGSHAHCCPGAGKQAGRRFVGLPGSWFPLPRSVLF